MAEEKDNQDNIAAIQAALEEARSRERELDASRRAMLFMLEDLEDNHRLVEHAKQEWIAVFDTLRDAVFIHDSKMRIIRANRAYADLAGMDIKEIIGKLYWQLFPKSVGPLPCCLRALEKAAAGEEKEEEIKVGDSIFRSRVLAIRDPDMAFQYFVHILEDITEKRRTEAERYRLTEAIRQAAEAIAVTDAAARIVYINPAFTRMFGYAPEEIIGEPTAILAAPGAETVQPAEAFGIVREQGAFQAEVLRRAKDGTVFPVYVNTASLHGAEGGFEGFVTAITDLRPIKEAQHRLAEREEMFRGIFEGALDGILLVDAETRKFLTGNPVFCRMLGYTHEELTRLGIADIRPEQELPYVVEQFERNLRGEIQAAEDIPIRRKDGSVFYADIKGSHLKLHGKDCLLGIFRDITEKRKAQAQLQLFRALIDHSSDGVFIVDPATGGLLDVNETACRDLRYTRDELLQRRVTDIQTALLDAAAWQAHLRELRAQGRATLEFDALRKDASRFPVEVSLQYTTVADQSYVIAMVRDITERKRAEEALRRSEEKYRSLVRNIPDVIWTTDQDGKTSFISDNVEKIYGYTPAEIYADPDLWFGNIHPDDTENVIKAFSDLFTANRQFDVEYRIRRKDGGWIWIQDRSVVTYEKDGIRYTDGVFTDITEHKRAEEALRESEERFRLIAETVSEVFWMADVEISKMSYISPAYERVWGRSQQSLYENPRSFIEAIHMDDRARVLADFELKKTGQPFDHEYRIAQPDGTLRWIWDRGFPVHEPAGGVRRYVGIAQDITERKQNEEHIQSLTRALRTLSSCNVALVHAQTEEELFRHACRNIVEIGGYRLAWVSYPGEGAEAAPLPFAHFGDDALFRLHAGLDDVPEHRRNCLTFAALRERKTQVCNNFNERPEDVFDPLREAGVAAILALPLLYKDESYGVLTVFSSAAETFGAAEVTLMEELASDLAYGIVTLRTRTERDRGAASLRLALEQTIASISLTLEKRDPYTAGHQQRVARIARAIAVEMGLSERQVEGIHFGALIHDIGKVYVPAEILNRPGRLTALEFGLIQTHSEVGFDIVKEIPFPWPVAQMIHQHHERLDGSGYPQGLKGDEIMLEARILAVADVLEAMASHRPYRAALGIEAGLDEIVRQRGRHFDPAAVGACVRLFREKGFRLEADSPEAQSK